MNFNMKNQLIRMRDNDCVVIDGTLRNKRTFERYRITKRMMFDIVSQGYVEITPGGVKLTAKGYNALRPKVRQRKDYYRARKVKGFVSCSVWVHKDDLDEFKRLTQHITDRRS